MKLSLKSFTMILAMGIPHLAHANLIQILHTNDCHSHFDHSIHREELGGYGRLKSMILEQRQWGSEQGMGTIAMDAGDFMEGNIYYVADRGKKSYELHGAVGYDVVTIGNHDYLMGTKDLNIILGSVKTSFTLLGANFYADKRYEHINKVMKPYYETVVNGVKIGVIGVTVDDPLYQWRIENGGISNAVDAVKKYAKILRERGNEVIIALTHVGLSKDKKIAKNVPDVDIIVGGHSHTELHEVVWQKSKNGKRIPIVQAGRHVEWLGQLIFDYDKKTKKVQVAHYKLLPVQNRPKDNLVEDKIYTANLALQDLFGEDWLGQVVGKSELRPEHLGGNGHVWQYFVNDAMMKAANTDLAVNAEALAGGNYPTTGSINRRQLYNANPRTFEFDFKYGYDVYSAEINGTWLALVSKVVMRLGLPLYFSGLEFEYKDHGGGKYSISKLKSKGQKLKLSKNYSVALSEAIVRGGFAITPWVKLLLKKPKHIEKPIWAALEDHLQEFPVLKESYLTDHFGRRPGSVEHMRVPQLSTENDE